VTVVALALLPGGCVKFLDRDPDTKTTDGKPSDRNGADVKKTTVDLSRITRANYERVKEGMSEKEVFDILGSPTSTNPSKLYEKGWEHQWRKDTFNYIVVNTMDGRVGPKGVWGEFLDGGNQSNGAAKNKAEEKKG
jgi:hypothetical protein